MKISKNIVSNLKDGKTITKTILNDILEEINLKELQKEADILNKIPEDRVAREYGRRYR